MNLETRLQMLIKVDKYADSEFRIKIFLIQIFIVVVFIKYTNFKNSRINLIPTAKWGNQACRFKYDISSGFLEARSFERERTKVAKRPL